MISLLYACSKGISNNSNILAFGVISTTCRDLRAAIVFSDEEE
jgi:hypothetical protein